MDKKARDNYINLRKKITNPKVIGAIKRIAAENLKSETEVCYDIIAEAAAKDTQMRIQNSMYGGLKN